MSNAVHIEAIAERPLSIIKQAGIVICASAVIAVCARIMVPLPFTPVPLTLANFGVLLVGLDAGQPPRIRRSRAVSCLGRDGTAGIRVVGTGQHCADAGADRRISVGISCRRVPGRVGLRSAERRASLATSWRVTLAEIVLFVSGISWLALYTHNWRQAAFFGLYPFLFAEVSKIMMAAAGAKRLRRSFQVR